MIRHKKIKSFNDFLFNEFDITKRNHCTILFNAFDITKRIRCTISFNAFDITRKIVAQFLFYPTPKMKIVARFPFLESATVALRNRVYDPDG